MTNTKFTPGPWTVENGFNVFGPLGGESGNGIICDDNDGWQVADVGSYLTAVDGDLVQLGWDVSRANVTLIAAAPELYSALDETVKDLVGYQWSVRMALKSDSRWAGVSELIQQIIDQSRAALAKARGKPPMTDHHTTTLDHYQGLVDQLANEDAALEKYRSEFAEKLMQEYTEDNHNLSWQVTEWLGEESTQLEGYLFSAMTDPDFDMTEAWRDWLTERFDALASSMTGKEIDEYQQEYF